MQKSPVTILLKTVPLHPGYQKATIDRAVGQGEIPPKDADAFKKAGDPTEKVRTQLQRLEGQRDTRSWLTRGRDFVSMNLRTVIGASMIGLGVMGAPKYVAEGIQHRHEQNTLRDDYKNLFLSIEEGDVQKSLKIIAQIRLLNGDFNQKHNEDNFLSLASRRGHTEIVKELIAAGADVNRQDRDHWTSLMYASKDGHTEIVKELIAAGARINLKNKQNQTALMIAVEKDYIEIQEILIRAGAKRVID